MTTTQTELDKLRDIVSDIIEQYCETPVDDYRAADKIIELLRPELVRDTPADWNGS